MSVSSAKQRPTVPRDPPSAAAGPDAGAEGQTLAGVVLQGEGAVRGRRMLRAVGVMLALLALTEVALRLLCAPDARALRDPLQPYGCYREDDLQQLVAARRAGAAGLDVVLLGDSVLASVNNRPGETVADYLQAALRSRLGPAAGITDRGASLFAINVWSLGRGGSHAADLYAALRQLEAEVPAGRPLLLVLNTNIIFFSRRHATPPMLYPCLYRYLQGDLASDQASDLTSDLTIGPALRAQLRLPAPPGRVEEWLTGWLTRHVYLYQQRRRLNEALFGGIPRETLRERARLWALSLRARLLGTGAGAAEDPNRSWSERGLSAAQYSADYDVIPFTSPEAVNYQMTQRLARRLAGSAWPALVFLTPQNHGLLGALVDNDRYRQASAGILAVFTGAGVRARSYDGQIPHRTFMDLDHLNAEGNRLLAAQLAEDLAPLLRAQPGSGR